MVAISWNCQGARSALTIHAFKKLRKKYDPYFIFLIETKNKSSKLEKMMKRIGFEEGFICGT